MHDGMGFFSQHVAITNAFEAALQAVDPSVSVPFWDYTQDFSIINATAHALPRSHEAFGKIDYAQLWDLDVWGSDYFGAAASSASVSSSSSSSSSSSVAEGVHTVTDGRWAYTRVPRADDVADTTTTATTTTTTTTATTTTTTKTTTATTATATTAGSGLHRGRRRLQRTHDKAEESAEEEGEEQVRSVGNAYGLLRSPWNLNPSPFVTRFHQQCAAAIDEWPTCRVSVLDDSALLFPK